jgi:hypothetical protein
MGRVTNGYAPTDPILRFFMKEKTSHLASTRMRKNAAAPTTLRSESAKVAWLIPNSGTTEELNAVTDPFGSMFQ